MTRCSASESIGIADRSRTRPGPSQRSGTVEGRHRQPVHRPSRLRPRDPGRRRLGHLQDRGQPARRLRHEEIVHRQAPDQVAAALDHVGLAEPDSLILSEFSRGRALWKIGTHTALVHHVIAPSEAPFCHRDARMDLSAQTPDVPLSRARRQDSFGTRGCGASNSLSTGSSAL